MTMIAWPLSKYDLRADCIVCNANISMSNATVVQHYHTGDQAFMCQAHICIAQQRALIRAWAQFESVEYRRAIQIRSTLLPTPPKVLV